MKPDLSISNFEVTGFEPRYFAELAGFASKFLLVIGFFALFEVAAHLFTPLTHPLQAPSDEKLRLYEKTLSDSSSYDLFMIGSSMTQSAFDPTVFDPIVGCRSFNAGIAGRSNTSWQLEMMREILANKNPKTIVYAIESWSLGTDPHVPNTQMFRFLTLYQNRDSIGNWFKQAGRGTFTTLPAFEHPENNVLKLKERYRFYEKQTLHQSGFLDVDAVGRPEFLGVDGPFKVLKEQKRALDTMMALAHAQNVELIFVQLPEFAGEIERWSERHEAFRSYIKENVVAKGFVYLDFNFDIDFPHDRIELFYDVNHLNGTGAKAFSSSLAKIMRKR